MRNLALAAMALAVGVAAIGAITHDSLETLRRQIRGYFRVDSGCVITFKGDANKAGQFWQKFDPYLLKMIELARSLQITDAGGIASYAALNLFPECDQSKPATPSFQIALGAMELRISKLLEQGS